MGDKPKVKTETQPGGGSRTTIEHDDGTIVRVTRTENGTTTKTTNSNGSVSSTFTDNEGNVKVIK